MNKPLDLTGQIINGIKIICRDLEVEKLKNKKRIKTYWKCICHCGNEFSAMGTELKNGYKKSCGCLNISMSEIGKSNSKQNEWIFEDNIAIGVTHNGDRFFIDLEDYESVNKYCWRLDKHGYVVANNKNATNKTIKIHRIIMNANSTDVIDHKDWDKSNNKKSNLRKCTKSENNVNIKKKTNNTSGYTGVKKSKNKWVAQISFNRKRIHLGTFETIEEAILVRNNAEDFIHNSFNGEINRQDFNKIFEGIIKDTSNAPDIEEEQEI